MSKIELGLHEHHAAYQASNPPPSPSLNQAAGSRINTDQGLLDTPFAKVNSVVDGSPADQAGLKAEDRIRRFGRSSPASNPLVWMSLEDPRYFPRYVQGLPCSEYMVHGSSCCCLIILSTDRKSSSGDVNWMNHERLSKVAATVQRNQGVSRAVWYIWKHLC
jgi:hypothetical protein